jgi:hypothetical protein
MAQRPDGGQDGPPADYIDVDVDSLATASQVLGELGTRLRTATDTVIPVAIDVLDAIPAKSDLYAAYAFCWGRWSAVLDSAAVSVGTCGAIARDAAAGYRSTDQGMAIPGRGGGPTPQ